MSEGRRDSGTLVFIPLHSLIRTVHLIICLFASASLYAIQLILRHLVLMRVVNVL
jgi:hypothetical protein